MREISMEVDRCGVSGWWHLEFGFEFEFGFGFGIGFGLVFAEP